MPPLPNGWAPDKSDCGTLPACRRHLGRQVITFILYYPKQVHADNFQFCTKPLLAMLNAVRSFRRLVERWLDFATSWS